MSNIQLTIRQDRVDEAPERILERCHSLTEHEITTLRSLKPPVNAEAVDAIIGNGSWTDTDCGVCNKESVKTVWFKPHHYCEYENPGVDVCEQCLTKAMDLIKGNNNV